MVRLRHFDDLGTTRIVTVTCHRRLQLLRHEQDIAIVLEEIDAARQKYDFRILAYVILPNHFHVVLLPKKPIKLGRVIGEIKSRSARKILDRWRMAGSDDLRKLQVIRDGKPRMVFWLRRCYDFDCRTPEDVREKIDYCHMNPVRAGLIGDPGEWRWSSYGWYSGVIRDLFQSILLHYNLEVLLSKPTASGGVPVSDEENRTFSTLPKRWGTDVLFYSQNPPSAVAEWGTDVPFYSQNPPLSGGVPVLFERFAG